MYDKDKLEKSKHHDQEEQEEEEGEERKDEVDKVAGKKEKSLGFFHGFAASVSVIIVSELGDKTFFIAAILAMKHSRYILALACDTPVADG